MTSSSQAEGADRAGRRRWLALIALALSAMVIALDATILNLALPTLATELDASSGDLQWFVDAYTLVFAMLILPAGLLGDRYGRKRLLLVGLALFAAASAACAASSSAEELILARAALGLGGAFVTALSFSVLPVLFAEGERQKAIALLAGAAFVAFPIGPLVGGWLLTNYWWGWVFLINLPVVGLALIAVVALLPESRSRRRPGLDLPGVLISSFGLAALTYGAIAAGQDGWGDATAVVSMIAGGAALAAFCAWELRTSRRERGQPLIDLALFRSRGFTWGTILATLVSFVTFGLLFVMPQYFTAVRGTDAMGAGLRLLPLIGGLVLGVIASSALQEARAVGTDGLDPTPRVGARAIVGFGFAVMASGFGMGATTAIDSSEAFVAAWLAVVGVGFGFALPATMNAALSAISAERSGVGSALIMALRFVGSTIGVAVLGTIISLGYRSRLDPTGLSEPVAVAAREGVTAGVAAANALGSPTLLHTVRAAFVDAMDLMLWASAGVAVTGTVLALAFLPRSARRRSRRASEREESAGGELAT